VLTIDLQSTLGDLVKLIKKSKRNIFIVTDDDDFIGLVLLDEVRNDMFDIAKYSEPISQFYIVPFQMRK